MSTPFKGADVLSNSTNNQHDMDQSFDCINNKNSTEVTSQLLDHTDDFVKEDEDDDVQDKNNSLASELLSLTSGQSPSIGQPKESPNHGYNFHNTEHQTSSRLVNQSSKVCPVYKYSNNRGLNGEERSRSAPCGESGECDNLTNDCCQSQQQHNHQHSKYHHYQHHNGDFDNTIESIIETNSGDGCVTTIAGEGDNRLSTPSGQISETYNRTPPRPSLISSHKLSLSEDGYDRIDALPAEMKFTILDALAILFSIGSFLFDIGTDIAVAVIHYSNRDYWYFGLTISFILIPTLVMTGISLRWYVLDAREEGSPIVTKTQWTLRVIFLLLQLGPILRYIDSLIYGIKFLQNKDKLEQKKYYHYMVYEDTDATMLRLFECFMEAAPQLVLQIYILAVHKSPYGNDHLMVLTQIAACIASLVSLSWSLVSYQRSLRLSLPNKISLTWQGIAVQFLWRFFVIAARVLALALFAAVYNWYISIVCGVHCLIMFAWIVSMKTSFCENRCEELGYNAVLAVMYIFCYFNPIDTPTRYRYAIYYTFMLCESTLLMTLWFIKADKNLWYRLPAIVGHYLSFFTGLLFMVAYYLLFHPSGDIKIVRNRKIDEEELDRQKHARRGGYKRQIHNGLWTTQGRVLHPRPAVPTALSSSYSDYRISKPRRSSLTQSNDANNRPSSKGTCV